MEKEIMMSKIVPPALDVRERQNIDKITELAISIKEQGQIQAIVVRPVGDNFEIIVGNRRYLACKQLGREKIKAVVKKLNDEDTILMRVHENLYREDMTPVDEANIVAYLHYELKWELAAIEKKLSKARTWIETRIDIFHMPSMLKDALREKQIPVAVANQIIKADEHEKQKYFLEMAINHGATARQVMQWIIDFKNESFAAGNTPPPEVVLAGSHPQTITEVECGICGHHMHAGQAIAINTCHTCWTEIYQQKKARNQPTI